MCFYIRSALSFQNGKKDTQSNGFESAYNLGITGYVLVCVQDPSAFQKRDDRIFKKGGMIHA